MLGTFRKDYDDSALIAELEKPKVDVKKLNKIIASGKIKINTFIDILIPLNIT